MSFTKEHLLDLAATMKAARIASDPERWKNATCLGEACQYLIRVGLASDAIRVLAEVAGVNPDTKPQSRWKEFLKYYEFIATSYGGSSIHLVTPRRNVIAHVLLVDWMIIHDEKMLAGEWVYSSQENDWIHKSGARLGEQRRNWQPEWFYNYID